MYCLNGCLFFTTAFYKYQQDDQMNYKSKLIDIQKN